MTDILRASTTAAAAPAPASTYAPARKSSRGSNSATVGDGDQWLEELVVCEAAGNKLVIRSYFKNRRTRAKVWDEPPTGASSIEPASTTKRREAEEKLKSLQCALDVNTIAGNTTAAAAAAASSDSSSKKSKKGRGFFSAFRKKPKDKNVAGTASGTSGTKGAFGRTNIGHASGANNGMVDGDEDIQRAISNSMGLHQDPTANSQQKAFNKIQKNNQWQEDQEQMEIAMAISLSEAAGAGGGGGGGADETPPVAATAPAENSFNLAATTTTTTSEEEMLQRAIEESRWAASGVASAPSPEADLLDFSEYSQDPSQSIIGSSSAKAQPSASIHDAFLDQKMPAQADLKKPPPPSFDPYAQQSPPAAAATAAVPSAFGESSFENQSSKNEKLRKMDDHNHDNRKPAATLGLRMYNKKTVEDEAGVV